MSTKASKAPSKARAGSQAEILESEEILKALILADSFDEKFTPITKEIPRALLPVANIPLLDYTIEFLAAGGVQEILVFCCAHAKKIQDYLKSSKWSRPTSGVIVTPVISTTSLSAGDALREMETHGSLKSDFILVSGDVVSNMNLGKVFEAHKARRKKDKNCIMTTVFKKAEPTHRTRSLQDDIVVAIDKPTGKLLYFDNDRKSIQLEIGLDIFVDHPQVQLRNDLIDCRIDICSTEVLMLFADNFDYQDLRQDFIRGMLSSEILGSKIYAHVISGEYAARVKCLRTYDSVSKDIIHRWTYPLVPDFNWLGTTSYTLTRNNSYKEDNVKLASTCVIHEETVIGSNTQIGNGSSVAHSVIGRNCKIGKNVKIHGSYLWDNVTVEDDSVISRSIVCSNVKVLANCKVEKGCILSWNVVVGPNVTLAPQTKLTTFSPTKDDLEFEENLTQSIDLGEKGFGSKWMRKEEDYTNSLIGFELYMEQKLSKAHLDSDPETDTEPDTPKKNKKHEEESGPTDQEKFLKEATDIVQSSIREKHAIDNIVLEMNSLKYAYNSNFIDCAVVILHTLLDEVKDEKKEKLLAAIQKILKTWSPLLARFITNEDEQVELLWGLQEFCEKPNRADYRPQFPFIMHTLYDAQTIDEEAIWKWVEEQKEAKDQAFVELSKNFLKWLKESEEEEEGDEEEDD